MNPGVNNTLKYWPSCQLAFLVDVLCRLEEPAARYRCLKLAVEIVTLFLALLFMRVCHHIKVGSISSLKKNNNSSFVHIFVRQIWMHIKPNSLAYKGPHIVRYRRETLWRFVQVIFYSLRWSSMGFFLINYTVLILTSWFTHEYIYNISHLKRDFKLVGLQVTKRHKLGK